MPEAKHFYEFGSFRLDPCERLLLRAGKVIPLAPKAFDTLLLLVENSGHLLKKDELMEQLWPGTFVEEVNLAQNISSLRKALAELGVGEALIETVPKKGYRFVAPVTTVSAATSNQAATPSANARWSSFTPRFWRRLVLSSVAVTAVGALAWGIGHRRVGAGSALLPIRSVAVLPLVNLSADPEQEYFSDGMTDELITDLAKFGKLRVISHTSVERYKQTKLSLPEIARELGVDAVVEGRVMRSGERVRITAQLIDAHSDRHLWAESYEGDLRDVLSLQDEVAQRIASKVGINLTAGEPSRPVRVVNPAAHDAYMRGKFYWNRLNCDGFEKGAEYFQQAVAQDPAFAAAYVGLAQSYFTLGDWGCSPQHEMFPKSKAAVLRALELDQNLGAAHAWLGKIEFFYEWEWLKAEKELKQAIELDANDVVAHLVYGVFLVTMGQREQAFAELRKAHEVDPTSELTNMVSVYVFYLARQYDQAIEEGRTNIELYPRSGSTYFWLGAAYERKGASEQANTAYLKAKEIGGGTPEELGAFQRAYRKSGIRGYWQQEWAIARQSRPNICEMVTVYAHLGDKERTLESLNEAFQQHCTSLRSLNVDPVFDSVREDRGFRDLLRRMNLPADSASLAHKKN